VGVGNLNLESVYFEEDVPFETIVSCLDQEQFKPSPNQTICSVPSSGCCTGGFLPSIQKSFCRHQSNVALYALKNLDTASTPYTNPEQHTHLIAGTDSVDQLDAGAMGNTHEEVRINGFGGDDLVIGNLADNLVWEGTERSDTRRSQQSLTQFRRGGSDMLYGGPENDFLHGQALATTGSSAA